MDKYALVQQKLDNFFETESQKRQKQKADLKLIISCFLKTDGTEQMVYSLYENTKPLENIGIDKVFKLNIIESAFVSYSKVEKTLYETINKIAKEQQKQEKEIQLLLLPTKQYIALMNWKHLKEINLTEIL